MLATLVFIGALVGLIHFVRSPPSSGTKNISSTSNPCKTHHILVARSKARQGGTPWKLVLRRCGLTCVRKRRRKAIIRLLILMTISSVSQHGHRSRKELTPQFQKPRRPQMAQSQSRNSMWEKTRMIGLVLTKKCSMECWMGQKAPINHSPRRC